MWIAIRLFASGAADAVLRGLSAAARWLLADWRNLAAAGFGLALAWTLIVTVPGLRADLAQARGLHEAEQLAHLGTIANFIDASAEAQRQAEANVARVTAEQERITDATLADYRADLAALRHRFNLLHNADRLRAGAAAAAPGGADPAGLPGTGAAAGRAAQATGPDRLPARHLTLADALIASEQALQLDALISWIEAQSAVRFTPEGGR